jgi:hypothetical protein
MKTNKFALLTLILLGLFSLNISAQKTEILKDEQSNVKCSSEPFIMPSSIKSGITAFEDFIKVMSLPQGKRQQEFSKLSNLSKSYVYKTKLATNLAKKQNLTEEQRSLILETIFTVSKETYSKNNMESVAIADKVSLELESKALGLFNENEAYEIFASMNGDKTYEIDLLNNYENILKMPTISKRKSMLRDSSPKIKSDVWKAQMIYYLVTAELNDSQRKFIAKIIPHFTPLAFDHTNDKLIPNMDSINLDAFENESYKLFTKQEVFVIFMSVGLHKMVPFKEIVTRNSELPEGGGEGNHPACECNYLCGALCWSCGGSAACTETTSGCGWRSNKPCKSSCFMTQNCP